MLSSHLIHIGKVYLPVLCLGICSGHPNKAILGRRVIGMRATWPTHRSTCRWSKCSKESQCTSCLRLSSEYEYSLMLSKSRPKHLLTARDNTYWAFFPCALDQTLVFPQASSVLSTTDLMTFNFRLVDSPACLPLPCGEPKDQSLAIRLTARKPACTRFLVSGQ